MQIEMWSTYLWVNQSKIVNYGNAKLLPPGNALPDTE